MAYFDGFVIAVPDANKEKFVAHARLADEIFLEQGAVRVVECWGEDIPPGTLTDFQGAVDAKDGESVAFSWIEWPDRETRDRAMAFISDPANPDPRMDPARNAVPFDGQRMIYGGFDPIVMEGDLASLPYVQGFIVPVPQDRREDYRKMAQDGWDTMFKPYGALCLVEAWGDDVPEGKVTDFYRAVKAEAGEATVFSFLSWPSRQLCDEAAEKMQNDPAMQMPEIMPFDPKRMVFGGFAPVVNMGA